MTSTFVAAVAVASVAGLAQAAVYIPFGTSSGSLAVHYNAGGPETPTNQHYVRAQNSPTNTNGATFNFDNSFDLDPGAGVVTMASIFQSVPNSFGLDLVLPAPTSLGGAIPALTAYDRTNSGPVAAGNVAWGLSVYFQTGVGPALSDSIVQNTLLRSNNADPATLTFSNVQPIAGGFTVDVSGFLNSDGTIYWYTPSTPNSLMSAFFNDGQGNFASGRIKFDGTLTYLTAQDTTPGIDYYGGTINYQLELIPTPGAAALLGVGALAGLRRRRS